MSVMQRKDIETLYNYKYKCDEQKNTKIIV